MCLAVVKKDSAVFEYSVLEDAYRANPDSCGLMYVENGSIQIIKGAFSWKSFSQFISIAEKSKSPVVLHFRTASSSASYFETSHPFVVNRNLTFVHNGNFFEFQNYFSGGYSEILSDTARFNEYVLKKLPANFLENEEIVHCLETYCKENMSKLVFMDAKGEIVILNESAGYWGDGLWYSNGGIHNYTGYGFSGAYYYNEGDVRHKGGLISVQMLPPSRRMDWDQCSICLGYFRREKLVKGKCGGCATYKELMNFVK